MTPEEYKKAFGARVTPSYNETPWDTRYALAEATAFVDFDCRILPDGTCKTGRGRPGCCCRQCPTGDLIPRIFESEKAIERVAALCDSNIQRGSLWGDVTGPSHGFWRLDGGCALPRKYRTTVCLTYNCAEVAGAPLDFTEVDLLKAIKAMDCTQPRDEKLWMVKHLKDHRNDRVRHVKRKGAFDDMRRGAEAVLKVLGEPMTIERLGLLRDAKREVERGYNIGVGG
jgi:hypothetical protein